MSPVPTITSCPSLEHTLGQLRRLQEKNAQHSLCCKKLGGAEDPKLGLCKGLQGLMPSVLLTTTCAMSCDFRSHGCHQGWSSTLQRGRAGLGPPHQELEMVFLTMCDLSAWHQLYEQLSPF